MRQEEPNGSLANYGRREQAEWLGTLPPQDGSLTLYRATPTGEAIAPGDYVTNDKRYAVRHIENNLDGSGKITQTDATLDDIYPADGPMEFWYVPKTAMAVKTAAKVQKPGKNKAWVRLDAPQEIVKVHKAFTKTIDEDDLYTEKAEKKGDWHFGIETEVHITVKWGLESDDPDPVTECLEGEKGGTVTVGKTEIFDSDEKNDVLVVRCSSKALARLHKKLTDDLDVPDTHPEYKPHLTIAYFKKGKAKKYQEAADKAFSGKGLKWDFDKVVFEDSEDKDTAVKLEA